MKDLVCIIETKAQLAPYEVHKAGMQTLTIGDLSGCFLFICVTPKQTVATHKVVYSFSLLTFTSEKVPQRPATTGAQLH